MTQAAVNNAIVLHRLSVSREDVRRADELYSKTSELQKILTNPEIPLAKKYDIIDKVFALDDTNELMKNLLGGYVIRAHHKEYDRSFEGRFCQLDRKLTGR